MGNVIELAERPLSIEKLFRLVEIAHDTRDHEIQRCALEILDRALHPPLLMMPSDQDAA